MDTSGHTTWDVRDGIGILTIDNPPQNRLPEPAPADVELLRRWTGDSEVRGLIITGKGRHFSAGADLEALQRLARDENKLLGSMREGREFIDHIEGLEIPTIAAIEGACFGGGLEIALGCHIRVCAENALLAFPEVNHNILPGMGGTVRLPGLIGTGRALETILSGDIIDAHRARESGLVDHVVAPRTAFDFSLALLKKMVAERPLEVIRSVVRALNNARTMERQLALEEETKMFCRLAVKMHG